MKKLLNTLLTVSAFIVMLSGAFAVVYEYFIFDKSVIPGNAVDIIMVFSLLNLAFFLIGIFISKKTER